MSKLEKDQANTTQISASEVSNITPLSRDNFTAKQVIAVSGTKSVKSLTIYQRVYEDEKMVMVGLCLTYSLLCLQPAKQQPIQLKQV